MEILLSQGSIMSIEYTLDDLFVFAYQRGYLTFFVYHEVFEEWE